MTNLFKKARSVAYGVAAAGLALSFAAPAAMAAGLTGQIGESFNETSTGIYGTTPDSAGLPTIIGNVINSVLALLGVILVCLIVYAGFLWMMAQGDAAKITKAKGIISSAVVGMILIFAAYAISSFVIEAVANSTGA